MIFGLKNKLHNPLIEAMAEPAFVFSENGEFLYHNIAGRDILKALNYPPDRRPERREAFAAILTFSGKGLGDGRITLHNTHYEMASRRFEEGTLLRLMPVAEDSHMLRLSQSLEIMPWGLITVQLKNEVPSVVYCNEKAGAFLNMSHKDMVGLPFADVARVFGFIANMKDYIHSKDVCYYDHETKIDGRATWYRFHFIPYANDQPYCLIVIDNTTDGKIMEGQYFQAQRLEALGQLAGGVAHDFNNILSIIDGYARIARKKVDPESEAFGYMEHIGKAVQRGSALTSQLLTFGRHKVMKEKVFDLGALAIDQEPLLRPLMDASIALSINAEEQVFVEVAPDNICQILLNVCINSRDAMPNGGNLIIECARTDDGRAKLQIIDTGCGMPPEVIAKMFDPFFTTKDQGKGTGLGLSMVYGLVKDMKGEITVSSKPGEGTVLTIFLPLSDKKPNVHEMIEDTDGNIQLKGFTALVAEDEPDLLDLVSGMIEEMGATVLKASNGNEALMIQEDYDGEIDFLLTDVVMPELNGVRLAEMFEACRPDSKILFMSGYPANGQMARVPVPEGAYLMPKPVDFDKLSALVKSMLKGQNENTRDRWKILTGHWKSA